MSKCWDVLKAWLWIFCLAVEFDTSEPSNPKCKLYQREGEEPFCSDEYATKVLQKCLSIPITMRAILKKTVGWLEMRKQKEVKIFLVKKILISTIIKCVLQRFKNVILAGSILIIPWHCYAEIWKVFTLYTKIKFNKVNCTVICDVTLG